MFLSSTGSKDTMTVTYEKCVAHYTQMLTLNAPVCVCTWWILQYIWITLRNCLWKVYTVRSTGVCCYIGFIIYNTRKMVARQLGSWRLRAGQAVLLLRMGLGSNLKWSAMLKTNRPETHHERGHAAPAPFQTVATKRSKQRSLARALSAPQKTVCLLAS